MNTHYSFGGNTGEFEINANQYLKVPIWIKLGPTKVKPRNLIRK